MSDKLSPREHKFVKIMAEGGVTGGEAAKEAGYKGNSSLALSVQASRLLSKDKISGAIESYRAKVCDSMAESLHNSNSIAQAIALARSWLDSEDLEKQKFAMKYVAELTKTIAQQEKSPAEIKHLHAHFPKR